MSILVSIIVPCYKQAHYLNQALESVIIQSYTNWECIIVNDGSPDNTDQVAEQWCKKDKRFRYIYQENGGLSSARNAGINVSKGEFILPLDSDDILHQNYLIKMVPALLENDIAIVSCYRKFFIDNVSNIVYEHKPIGNSVKNLLFENILMPSSLFRKKYWKEVGGYDEKMKNGFEDWEFWVAITKLGYKFKIIEEFLFYYRKAKKSMLIDTLKYHRISNLEYVIKKHNDFYKENYDNTIKYLFFLVKLYRDSENKVKKSSEYKVGNVILKPFKVIKRLF